jgi:5,5'-dehydrodivanillate O-demethylase
MPCISIGGSGQRNLIGAAGTPPTSGRWSVPIDDTHTMMVRAAYKPADNPGQFKEGHLPAGWKPIAIEPYREYKESDTPTLGYSIARIIASEDAAIMDSLGGIVDRENENLLTYGDYGIQRLRQLYLREMERVEAGQDPLGTIRDPAQHTVIPVPAYEMEVDEAERKTLMPV